ncbi:MAG: undecaprenyldiphospho-muramoylpentapeptide beta-N-acetylglucosaminyltransferase [Deltaproteobacteria bacterium]|nr:undecaprenyldiphospho-muramoylpentapeptide beta-N-acetylglucosaminyltransferase [Deltaproteobacteria bacterium]
MSERNPKLLVAGGGTGGHVFPGLAIAEAWVRSGGEAVFVGTPQGQETTHVPKAGFELHLLNVGRLKGYGLLFKIKTLLGLPKALWQAKGILRKENPDVVLGIGGYASGPACIVAAFTGRFVALADQNAHPGLTNRVLSRFAKVVYTSFEESAAFFPSKKVNCFGNPIRAQISKSAYEISKDEFHVFVFGGSQGAVGMNRLWLEALALIPDCWNKLRIVHQAGATDEDEIKEFYHKNNLKAEVSRFFDDMSERYRWSHLLVCRSGAGTVTELALCGRPAVLVPYPQAADDHQTKNARAFVHGGGCWLMPQDSDPSELAAILKESMEHPESLAKKATIMETLARPNAATDIVSDLKRRVNV